MGTCMWKTHTLLKKMIASQTFQNNNPDVGFLG